MTKCKTTNKYYLAKHVSYFRRLFEYLGPVVFRTGIQKFPYNCCDYASVILGALLVDHGFKNVKLIKSETPFFGVHYWLSVNGIYVDITIDQFNVLENNELKPKSVAIGTTEFHKILNGVVICCGDFRVSALFPQGNYHRLEVERGYELVSKLMRYTKFLNTQVV